MTIQPKLYVSTSSPEHPSPTERAVLTVELRSVYGRPLAYPSGPRSMLIAEQLLGQATLSLAHLITLEQLGFDVRDVLGRDWRGVLTGRVRI